MCACVCVCVCVLGGGGAEKPASVVKQRSWLWPRTKRSSFVLCTECLRGIFRTVYLPERWLCVCFTLSVLCVLFAVWISRLPPTSHTCWGRGERERTHFICTKKISIRHLMKQSKVRRESLFLCRIRAQAETGLVHLTRRKHFRHLGKPRAFRQENCTLIDRKTARFSNVSTRSSCR